MKYFLILFLLIGSFSYCDEVFEEIYPEDNEIWLDGQKVPIKD